MKTFFILGDHIDEAEAPLLVEWQIYDFQVRPYLLSEGKDEALEDGNYLRGAESGVVKENA